MKKVKLALLKENGQPLGWVVSAFTMTFCGACYVYGLTGKEEMARVVESKEILYALLFAGCTGMTLKKPLSWFTKGKEA